MWRAYVIASLLTVLAAATARAEPVPLTDIFQVNAYGTGEQLTPSVCTDSAGNFVVAFQDGSAAYNTGLDGDYGGIRARRVTANGTPQGFMEFAVNEYTTNEQRSPKVACGANGDFVVVWGSGYFGNGPDGYGEAVAARRFNADGTPKGTEFVVNTSTEYDQSEPDVCSAADGDFVIVWTGTSYHVYGQRYDDAGNTAGTEFQVDLSLLEYATDPAVACDAAGNFIVAWSSTDNSGDVLARRYTASGLSLGTPFQVNSYTTGYQGVDLSGYFSPLDVAAAPDGQFVVVWQDEEEFGGYALAGRRFNADGSPAGTDFQIDQPGIFDDPNVDVSAAMSDTGHFAVVWSTYDSFSSTSLVEQRMFDPQGQVDGDEIHLNASFEYDLEADVAAASNGRFVTAWAAYNGLTDSGDIYAEERGATLCGSAPASGCRNTPAGAAKVQIKNFTAADKDSLKWNWKKGDATPFSAIGDPVIGVPRYEVCVYDSSLAAQPLYKGLVPPNGGAVGQPPWKNAGTTGFSFVNRYDGIGSNGVTKLKLKSGVAGKSKVQVQARGDFADLALLPLTAPVTVQLVADSGTSIECWQTVFSTPDETTSSKFEATGP